MKRSHVRRYYRRMNLRHFRRWWRERCPGCDRRLYFNESAIGVNGESWHGVCDSRRHWRRVAAERLHAIDVMTDVWSIDSSTVKAVMEGRMDDEGERGRESSLAFRVFYDLERLREAAAAVKRQDTAGT